MTTLAGVSLSASVEASPGANCSAKITGYLPRRPAIEVHENHFSLDVREDLRPGDIVVVEVESSAGGAPGKRYEHNADSFMCRTHCQVSQTGVRNAREVTSYDRSSVCVLGLTAVSDAAP